MINDNMINRAFHLLATLGIRLRFAIGSVVGM